MTSVQTYVEIVFAKSMKPSCSARLSVQISGVRAWKKVNTIMETEESIPSIVWESDPDGRETYLVEAVFRETSSGGHSVWYSQHDRSLLDINLEAGEPLEFSLLLRADSAEQAEDWFLEYMIPTTEVGGDEEWDEITVKPMSEDEYFVS